MPKLQPLQALKTLNCQLILCCYVLLVILRQVIFGETARHPRSTHGPHAGRDPTEKGRTLGDGARPCQTRRLHAGGRFHGTALPDLFDHRVPGGDEPRPFRAEHAARLREQQQHDRVDHRGGKQRHRQTDVDPPAALANGPTIIDVFANSSPATAATSHAAAARQFTPRVNQ